MSTKSIFALALLTFTLPVVADTVTVSNRSHYSINITNQIDITNQNSVGFVNIFPGQSHTMEMASSWFIKPFNPFSSLDSPDFRIPYENATYTKRYTEVIIRGDTFSPKIETVTTVFNPNVEVTSQTYTLSNWAQLQSSDAPAAIWQPQP
ncbi:MAG: hypothetical protein EPN17_14040 [Methylobacter sp.]|nr:MAG: hypothetical protein EPN17_14040 [Methylobacter sp.]